MGNELVYPFRGRIPFSRSVAGLWIFTIGAILLVMFRVQILTGITLAMSYVPTAELAFDSIIHIMHAVRHGELLRNMHAIGASLSFFACYLHIFRGMYYNVYRKPWTTMWMVNVTLYILLMMTAFLGHSLIWGQKSYWAATVVTRFAQAIPLVGDPIYAYLVGSHTPGTPMLGHFFVIHSILSFVIIVAIAIHIRIVQLASAQAMKRKFSEKESRSLLFGYKITDFGAIKITLFLMVFAWFLLSAPYYLSSADNFIAADPTTTPATVASEWYFLPFFSILHCLPNGFVELAVMCGSILTFYFPLWLDTSQARFRHYSKLVKCGYWLWVINACFLGWLGSKTLVGPDLLDGPRNEEGWTRAASQFSTLIWFAWFLIVLPCHRFLEKQDWGRNNY